MNIFACATLVCVCSIAINTSRGMASPAEPPAVYVMEPGYSVRASATKIDLTIGFHRLASSDSAGLIMFGCSSEPPGTAYIHLAFMKEREASTDVAIINSDYLSFLSDSIVGFQPTLMVSRNSTEGADVLSVVGVGEALSAGEMLESHFEKVSSVNLVQSKLDTSFEITFLKYGSQEGRSIKFLKDPEIQAVNEGKTDEVLARRARDSESVKVVAETCGSMR